MKLTDLLQTEPYKQIVRTETDSYGKEHTLNTVYVNKTVLLKAMSDAGFDFDAVKKRWESDGRLQRGQQGIAHYMSICGIKAYYIKLIMSDLTEEKYSDLPF